MGIADDLWEKGYLPHAWTEFERNKVLALWERIKELREENQRLREAMNEAATRLEGYAPAYSNMTGIWTLPPMIEAAKILRAALEYK